MTKRDYLGVIAVVAVIFIISYFLKLAPVMAFGQEVIKMVEKPIIYISAIVLAFAFFKAGHYVWIMIACAAIVAYADSYFIAKTGTGSVALTAKACAFLSIVYLLNMARVFIRK